MQHIKPVTNEKDILTTSMYCSHKKLKNIWGRTEKPNHQEEKSGLKFKRWLATSGISVGGRLLSILLSSD